MGRTGIYACGESVRRRNSLESVALFSLKQEAPASIGGSTFTDKPLSRDAIITLIALLFNLLCTFAGCEMESISHEDNIQAHRDAVQAHEDAVQAHRDFSQSQSIENNNAALQTQISKNTSLDGANDDE